MEILLIRHGQSQADLEDRHEGRADFPLTELGERQARLAAQWLQEYYPPELILANPLKRAWRTAELISEAVGAPLRPEPEIMEWNNGLLAGLLRGEAERLYPLPMGGRRPHDKMVETESQIEFRARAETFWSRFCCDYVEPGKYNRIALVSHGGMINQLFRCFLQLPLTTDVIFSSGDTGIHLWRVGEKRRLVVFANRQEHLIGLKE